MRKFGDDLPNNMNGLLKQHYCDQHNWQDQITKTIDISVNRLAWEQYNAQNAFTLNGECLGKVQDVSQMDNLCRQALLDFISKPSSILIEDKTPITNILIKFYWWFLYLFGVKRMRAESEKEIKFRIEQEKYLKEAEEELDNEFPSIKDKNE